MIAQAKADELKRSITHRRCQKCNQMMLRETMYIRVNGGLSRTCAVCLWRAESNRLEIEKLIRLRKEEGEREKNKIKNSKCYIRRLCKQSGWHINDETIELKRVGLEIYRHK